MVLLAMTSAMVAAIRESQRLLLHPPACGEDQGTESRASEPSLDDPRVGKPISHSQIVDLSKRMRQHDNHGPMGLDQYHLDVLLRGSFVYVPPPKPKPEPTAEFKGLMGRLRREEEARAYDRLVHPQTAPDPIASLFSASRPSARGSLTATTDADDEITYADVNRQLTLVLNILISIVACSAAIWLASSSWSTPKRLGLSMGGSGIVGVAEVVVYNGYLRRLKNAKERERRAVERKKVVRTWVVGGKSAEEKALGKKNARTGVEQRKSRKN